jgi:hypothetical protein
MPAPNTSLLDSPLLEPILLRKASRRARGLTNSARERMRPWVLAAHARYVVALELRDRDTLAVALDLLRDAAFFALCAIEVAEPSAPAPPTSLRVAWERFEQLSDANEAPPALAVARTAFAKDDSLALDNLAVHELQRLRPAAEEAVGWLLGLAQIQTPKRLTLQRRVRMVLLTAGVTVVGWTLLSYWVALAALAHPGH